jgi:hypothetical protein
MIRPARNLKLSVTHLKGKSNMEKMRAVVIVSHGGVEGLEVCAAHERMESNESFGKIVLKIESV